MAENHDIQLGEPKWWWPQFPPDAENERGYYATYLLWTQFIRQAFFRMYRFTASRWAAMASFNRINNNVDDDLEQEISPEEHFSLPPEESPPQEELNETDNTESDAPTSPDAVITSSEGNEFDSDPNLPMDFDLPGVEEPIENDERSPRNIVKRLSTPTRSSLSSITSCSVVMEQPPARPPPRLNTTQGALDQALVPGDTSEYPSIIESSILVPKQHGGIDGSEAALQTEEDQALDPGDTSEYPSIIESSILVPEQHGGIDGSEAALQTEEDQESLMLVVRVGRATRLPSSPDMPEEK